MHIHAICKDYLEWDYRWHTNIFSSTLTRIQSELTVALDDAGMSLSSEQKQLMNNVTSNTADTFKEIETCYLQDKYFQEHLHYRFLEDRCSLIIIRIMIMLHTVIEVLKLIYTEQIIVWSSYLRTYINFIHVKLAF